MLSSHWLASSPTDVRGDAAVADSESRDNASPRSRTATDRSIGKAARCACAAAVMSVCYGCPERALSSVLWLGMLGASQARLGNFAAAIETARKACEIADEVRRPADIAIAYSSATRSHGAAPLCRRCSLTRGMAVGNAPCGLDGKRYCGCRMEHHHGFAERYGALLCDACSQHRRTRQRKLLSRPGRSAGCS